MLILIEKKTEILVDQNKIKSGNTLGTDRITSESFKFLCID